MRELLDILAAYDALIADQKCAALATVIQVEGSAYRRPGARMLIAEDGRTWGGVSGGCLERDVAQRGRGVIASDTPFVMRYDTSDDEQIGNIATGCGGTVEILIQPITLQTPGPMHFFARVLADRAPVTIATVVRAGGAWKMHEGSCTNLDADLHDWPAPVFEAAVQRAALSRAGVIRVDAPDATADVFVETIHPPQRLVVFGAGPDVVPVLRISKTLGWHVTIVAASASHAIADRFSTADVLRMTSVDQPLAGVDLPADAAVVVMTHNVHRDGAILSAMPLRPRYLGVLGPKHRTQRLLDAAPLLRSMPDVYAPIGFDIGAEAPEEIALAIMAEIQTVLRGATGQPLRDLDRPIHAPAVALSHALHLRSVACPI